MSALVASSEGRRRLVEMCQLERIPLTNLKTCLGSLFLKPHFLSFPKGSDGLGCGFKLQRPKFIVIKMDPLLRIEVDE
ncbi:hypothetical protein AQUCO_03900039v1 [Aquilegia coerulea]|uniref:Uncharacterized protein n=1 Tax=Aquilegia coerulea TaxID=218851 RepID=A0A2G5CST1_AQUCA|nr:hypothetical protein AQUCO_03900039v1 [Aquilegia coerulea]